jgi:hypothetical protein
MMEDRDKVLAELRVGRLSGIIDKFEKDDRFCAYLHAFYKFYMHAERLGKADVFIGDMIKAISSIVTESNRKEGE